MRKIFLIILTVFLWLFGYAQFPITQNLGAPSTLVLNKGGFKSDSALVIPSYSDTTRANQSLGKTYPGNIIRVGNLVYIRNFNATGWILVGSGGGGGGSFDTVYAKYPIRVDTTGVKDTLYLAQPFLDSVYNNSPGFLDGLVSTGGVDLVDTSAIVIAPIIWKRNGVVITQNTNALFPIPRADTLNFRVDIIYINSLDSLVYVQGIQDTANAIAPALPPGGILITYVNVYGSSRIVNPAASNYQRTGVLFVDLNSGQITADSTRLAWNQSNGSLIIGNQAANSNPSAILQLTSNNKGFLMPTMSAALRNGIASPANGLMVYDTDSSALFYFNGNNWISLSRKPNLQQVTDVGDSTTNSISSYGVTCVSGVWETENLSVSNYANGDPIPEVTNNATWASLTTGAWCWYNNDSATYWRRGKLYNWYAVNDPRGLAPNGYYIPSENEFDDLAFCLGGSFVAGGKMKSTTIWSPPNTGATNSSGFNAIPAGRRTAIGSFTAINTDAYYWTSASTGFRVRNLNNTSATLNSSTVPDVQGLSVRVKRINGFNPLVQITSKTKIDPAGITFSKTDGTNSGSITLNNNNLTAKTSELKLPDSSGTLVLSVNNNFADSKGNITISTGGADSSVFFTNFRADTMRASLYANKVPYTGATGDVDLGTFKMNAQSFHVKGTAGNGHIGFKHQSAAATAGGQETSLYADNNGNIAWQNANQYRTTLLSSNNTANRIYTYPDSSGTLALLSNVNAKQDTSTAWKTGGNFNVNAGQFIGSNNNASVRFRANNTESFYIDSSNASINLPTPSSAAFQSSRILRFFGTGATANAQTGYIQYEGGGGSNGGAFNIYNSNGGINLRPSNGDVFVFGGTPQIYSASGGLRLTNNSTNSGFLLGNYGSQTSGTLLRVVNNYTVSGETNPFVIFPNGNIKMGQLASSFIDSGYTADITGNAVRISNTAGLATPNSTALLDLTSTNRGLLIPRMTTSQRDAISTPASQLLVANTTEKTIDMYNGTTWNTIGGGYSTDLAALQTMGATIKTSPIGQPLLPITASAMVSSRSYFSAVYLNREATITGASWFQSTQGVYVGTGGGYNGIGLYRDSLGTLILVDSTTRDTTIWKATANTWNQKAFAGGSRTLQPGVYYLVALVNTVSGAFPAGQTAPVIGNWSTPSGNNGTFTLVSNSRKIMGGVQTGVTALPTSQAMTAWNNLANFYFSLYLY